MEMVDKTEWEIVDGPERPQPRSAKELLKIALGPWWKWKLAAGAAVMGAFLVFMITIAGVFIIGAAVLGVSIIIIAKLRQWMGKQSWISRSNNSVARRPDSDQ